MKVHNSMNGTAGATAKRTAFISLVLNFMSGYIADGLLMRIRGNGKSICTWYHVQYQEYDNHKYGNKPFHRAQI